MNWPLVTRSRLEYGERHIKLLKTVLAEASADLRECRKDKLAKSMWAEMKELRASYDELVKTIVGMKRDGFEPTPESIELVEEKELPDSIWEAIQEVSVKGTREYYTNMAHAHEAIEAGTPHKEIIHTILYGLDVEV